MPSIKKILFPVDFSNRCAGAARYVESFAGWFQAEIMLLHVVDTATYAAVAQQLHPSRQDQVRTFLADELEQFSTRRVCTIGDPAEEIVKTVRSWTPDLVMMPTYGLGFHRPSLLGSVTAKVLHDVECPVWTGIHTEEAPPLEKLTFRSVLCAVDLGLRSTRVLEWALSFAGEHTADLAIVHATPCVEAPPLVAEARSRVAALLASAGTNAAILINEGEPAKVVVCAAKDFRADLLVIGRHDASSDDGYLRHNAYAIIRESPCPVISI
jgi:nucleotide-binding universal stress UspA family protein